MHRREFLGAVTGTIGTTRLSARDDSLTWLHTHLDALGLEGPLTFPNFVQRVNPSLLRFEHIPRLLDVGERIITGELQNVMILEPPRYFKSEVFSRLLSACYMTRHPSRLVGLTSYGSDLAWSLSEDSRNYYAKAGGTLSKTATAKKRWRIDRGSEFGGEMWAAGVGGPLLGFGYHLGIVDDPTDPEKAHSYAYQMRFTKWWPDKFISRGEPGAQKVVVMQRLGVTDPIDFLLRREIGDDEEEAPEYWHVVLCDEIRSKESIGHWDGPMGLPKTCTLEPDPRKVGAVLAPSRMSKEQVERRQRVSGIHTTATQRQQRPTTPKGDFWREMWFNRYDELPADAYDTGWDWDLAYTKNDVNSASAGIRTARGPGNRTECNIYVLDIDWDYLEFPELVKFMGKKDGPHYIEGKASGKSAKQALKKLGIMADEVTVTGDKMARAAWVQPIVSNGRVHVRSNILRRLLQGTKQGLLNVRASDLARGVGELDLNDAFVQALTRHNGRQGKKRRFAFTPSQLASNGGST